MNAHKIQKTTTFEANSCFHCDNVYGTWKIKNDKYTLSIQ